MANSILPSAEATRLWKLYGFETVDDLDLDDLAYAMGVLVMVGPLHGADAWLLRKGKRGIIRVSEAIPELGRRRFAVAHELGHWMLHENLSQILACTSEDMVTRYKASPPEIEANSFAAELLMPTNLFAPLLGRSRPTALFVNELADQFRTTRTAVAFRIADVSTDYFAVVASVDGVIKWWHASKPLREKIWISPGNPVSQYSVAAKFFDGSSLSGKPEEVNVDDWIAENRGLAEECFIEDVIPMPSYGLVLSLLWLP